MSEVSSVVIDDDVEIDDDSADETTVTPGERERLNGEARRRIEQMREDAALRRALNDDIFDY